MYVRRGAHRVSTEVEGNRKPFAVSVYCVSHYFTTVPIIYGNSEPNFEENLKFEDRDRDSIICIPYSVVVLYRSIALYIAYDGSRGY